MNKVQPIRSISQIDDMKRILRCQSERNYMLFALGINYGRRISDLLKLTAGDMRKDTHVTAKEQKTSKRISLALNDGIKAEVMEYIKDMPDSEYLFKSREGENTPITRKQAYNIINGAAVRAGVEEVGTHTLRETFGYHFYMKTHDIATLQLIFGHSSPAITLRYIGITQDIVDNAMRDFSL